MGIIGIPKGTLTIAEVYELGATLLKCGYGVRITEKRFENGEKMKVVIYQPKQEEKYETKNQVASHSEFQGNQ